jgi:hypothetical protein
MMRLKKECNRRGKPNTREKSCPHW